MFSSCAKGSVLDSECDYSVFGIKALLPRKHTSLNQLNCKDSAVIKPREG